MKRKNKINIPCIFGKYCDEHKFVHGSEAEEFRSALELLLQKHLLGIPTYAIRRLLDRIDAKDSLAYLSFKKKK